MWKGKIVRKEGNEKEWKGEGKKGWKKAEGGTVNVKGREKESEDTVSQGRDGKVLREGKEDERKDEGKGTRRKGRE